MATLLPAHAHPSPHSCPPFSPVLPVTSPRLTVPRFLEVGTSGPLACSLDELFPASEAQVQLALGNQMLNTSVLSHGDTLTATATATASAEQEGAREIVCNVTLGGESREIRKNLTIYSKWIRGQKSWRDKARGQGIWEIGKVRPEPPEWEE